MRSFLWWNLMIGARKVWRAAGRDRWLATIGGLRPVVSVASLYPSIETLSCSFESCGFGVCPSTWSMFMCIILCPKQHIIIINSQFSCSSLVPEENILKIRAPRKQAYSATLSLSLVLPTVPECRVRRKEIAQHGGGPHIACSPGSLTKLLPAS